MEISLYNNKKCILILLTKLIMIIRFNKNLKSNFYEHLYIH